MIDLLLWPLLTCCVLAGIHAYFGYFVLNRGILFIDLAMAQWAALGYLVAHFFHVESPVSSFIIAFLFTILAGLILIALKPLISDDKQEAVIGVLYLTGITVAVSVVSFTGMEGHHFHEMLSGQLLFVTPLEAIVTTILYGVISIILFNVHRLIANQHHLLSLFLFYGLFGFVVTSSVKLVGLLLVFSYLVLPILTVSSFKLSFKRQLFTSYGVSVLSSVCGLFLSFFLNLPPSIAIILCLILTWVISLGLLKSRTS